MMLVGRPSNGDIAERALIIRLSTLRRLTECHGEERATAIMAGRDPKTQEDLAAWRALGRRKGRAA